MKNIIIAIALIFTSSNLSFAGEDPNSLYKEINRKMTIDFTNIKLFNERRNYVLVHFKITNNKIEILEINGSNGNLTDVIAQELEQMKISSNYVENKVYQYKFKFTVE